MRLPKPVLSLLVPLALIWSGPRALAESAPPPRLTSVTSGVSQGCSFSVSAQQRSGFPPQYDIVVTRAASSTCPWGAGSTVVGSTYNSPALSLVANDLGVAVSFTVKSTPSGSAAIFLYLDDLAPDTLGIVRSTALGARNSSFAGYVYSGDLTILTDGTTLEVRGTKSGVIPGETGSGSNYVATFPDFFTSTTAPSVVAY